MSKEGRKEEIFEEGRRRRRKKEKEEGDFFLAFHLISSPIIIFVHRLLIKLWMHGLDDAIVGAAQRVVGSKRWWTMHPFFKQCSIGIWHRNTRSTVEEEN